MPLPARDQEGRQGITAEVRVDGDGVHLQDIEDKVRVAFRRRAHIGSLGIQYHGDIVRNHGQGLGQDAQTG